MGRQADITPAEHSTRHQVQALARVPMVRLGWMGSEGDGRQTGGIGDIEFEDRDEAVDAGKDDEATKREDEY